MRRSGDARRARRLRGRDQRARRTILEELAEEESLADADEILDAAAEPDETPFDETRLQYSGVEEGDGDVDVEEYAEAGALFDDPDDVADDSV